MRKAQKMRTEFGKCEGGGRRKAARTDAPLLATLSTVVEDHRAAIVNVSRSGARLTAPYLPQPAEKLIFTAEDVQAFGEVVWSRNNQCGVVFESAILPAEVARLKRAANLI